MQNLLVTLRLRPVSGVHLPAAGQVAYFPAYFHFRNVSITIAKRTETKSVKSRDVSIVMF